MIMQIDRLSANIPSYPADQVRVPGQQQAPAQPEKIDQPAKNLSEMKEKQDAIQSENEKKKLEDAVKGLNGFLEPTQTSLKFQLHEELNEYYVSIVNDSTKEVVKEIPARKLLDMYAAMKKFLGLVVDKKI